MSFQYEALIAKTRFEDARLGGEWWVRCSHTATGEPLVEEYCPHFATRPEAVAWLGTRTPCEWCWRPCFESDFCSDPHEAAHEARYVSPRFRRTRREVTP